jgi:peptidoglycan/LPS O-acetylase OafA/YrhL
MTSVLDRRVAPTPPYSPRKIPRESFRPDIEGLRAVAILLVVLSHAGVAAVAGGYVGVDVFFVLSGFLITSLLLREVAASGRISIPRFYARRALRLLPASALVLVCTLIAARFWLSPLLVGPYTHDAAAAAGYVSNLVFAHRGTDYLASDASPSPFQHFWSLAVEEQFYLAWPLLIIAATALGRRRLLGYALAALAAASLILSVTETHRSAPWAYFGTHTRAWELAVGALLAAYAERVAHLPRLLGRFLGWAGLTAILLAATLYDDGTAYPGLFVVLPVAGAAAVIAGGNDALAIRPMAALGRLSYGWYLWHWPVLIIAPVALGISGSVPQRLALAIGALGLAWLSLRLVENPIRYSRVLRSRARYGLALGASLFACVLAVVLVVRVSPPAIAHGAAAAELEISPDRPQVLAQAIRAGERLTALPANLTPSLKDAAADLPKIYHDGCHASSPATRVTGTCAFGDLQSEQTVVLLGDSHAAQWFPALERLAVERHWRLASLTKSGCTAADSTIWIDTLQRAYTECDSWRRSAIARIVALKPSLVVVSSTFVYRLADPSATWRSAWARTFTELSVAGAPIAVLSDTPTMNVRVPVCLSQHPTRGSTCNRPVGASLNEPQRQALLGFGSAVPVTVVDPIPWLCSSVCPVVLGNLLVYRDSTHLTTAMSAALAPLLAESLPALR